MKKSTKPQKSKEPKERVFERRVREDMVSMHAGPHAVYAAAVYEEGYITAADEGGISAVGSRFILGVPIHAIRASTPERQQQLRTLISAATILSQDILSLIQDEERILLERPKRGAK